MQTIQRNRFSLLLLTLALCLTVGCAQQPQDHSAGAVREQSESNPWHYTLTDSTGAEIVLNKQPETVAILFSSYVEIWNLAGGSVAVTVGESVDRGFAPPDITLVDEGAGKAIDHELLLAAQPDFIIGSADIEAQVETCRIMTDAGIPSALFRVDTFDDYLSVLKICTDITGNPSAYTQHGTAIAEQIDQTLSAVAAHLNSGAQPKEILFIRAGSQYSSTKAKRAPDNFVCTMLDALGAHNIADDADILLDGLSLEEILLRNPDFIFLTTMGSEEASKAYIEGLFSQDGWNGLSAVKSGNYAFLPKDLFHFKPNARWAEAYTHLAELLYPELNTHA